MFRFPRRGVARLAVGLVALGAPFVAASAAQGALGTSTTLSTANINRPVLTSVTAQGDTGLVSFCFATPGNQAITSQGGYDPTLFFIGGYENSTELNPVTVEQESNQCVQATFDQGQRPQYTIGGVREDAVFAIVAGNPIGNEDDGAPLNGSESHNGTRGLTTGPDLQTVARPGSNRLAFIFDQNVSEGVQPSGPPGLDEGCATTDFLFYDQAGNPKPSVAGLIVSVSDNVVVVQYDANVGDATADATIATVEPRASDTCGGLLMSDTPPDLQEERQNVKLSVAVPGSSGTTDEINLVSAALVGDGETNQIDYTFDKGPVSLVGDNAEAANCFTANMSNSRRERGDAATAMGNVVRVTFDGGDGGFQLISEMGVSASYECDEGPVQSQTGQVGSTQGGKPIGGNVGAFGTGYTNAPEALGLSRSGGDMIVRIDQRADPDEIELGEVNLINAQGAPFGPDPSSASVTGNGSPFAIHRVTFSFDPTAAQSAAGLQLLDGAIETFEGEDEFDFGQNAVDQIFGFGGLT